MPSVTEAVVEQAALGWLRGLGYAVVSGPDIAPDAATPERASYGDVYLLERLRAATVRLNPHLPADVVDEAVRKATRTESPGLVAHQHSCPTQHDDLQKGELRRLGSNQ